MKCCSSNVGSGNVEGRIGRLEREMGVRSDHPRRPRIRDSLGEETRLEDDESSGSAAEADRPHGDAEASAALGFDALSTRQSARRHRKTGQTDVLATSPPASATFASSSANPGEDSETDESDSGIDHRNNPPPLQRSASKPALPPYVDARPTIKTYFKIYSPSRGGRMLSVYESAPDRFNFSQSWGWKSSTLMLDDGMMSGDEGEQQVGVLDMPPDGTDAGAGAVPAAAREGGSTKAGDGRLRFMVVIGNI